MKIQKNTHPDKKPARFFAKLTWSAPENNQSEPVKVLEYLTPFQTPIHDSDTMSIW